MIHGGQGGALPWPKTLMQLCRHSTPSLTLQVYAKARDGELRAAVDQLPKLSLSGEFPQIDFCVASSRRRN